jgi:uncharacterized protein YfaP (DUF2135 family)
MPSQPLVACALRRILHVSLLLSMMFLAGCGGGVHTTNVVAAPNTFTISGTVSGLSSTGLVLQDNGGDSLPVNTNGTFTFLTPLNDQAAYNVLASAQPAAQICNVLNGSGTISLAKITNISVVCVTPPAGGSGTIALGGGTVTTPAATVTAPPGSSIAPQHISIATLAAPPGLPKALTPVGAAVDVSVDSPAMINAPFLIVLPYDPAGVVNENDMAVVHFDTARSRYEPVTILKHDTTAHTFEIESRTFSPFSIVEFVNSTLDASHSVTNFSPGHNGWNISNFGGIPNFGSNFLPGGNCLGMSAYATWYFGNHNSPFLFDEFSASGTPSIAQLVAVRAHLAQSQYWAQQSSTYLSALGSPATAELMKMYLDIFDQPLILLLGKDGNPTHAGVLYGYDSGGFQFYDVNVVGAPESVSFNGVNFGTYSNVGLSFNTFTYVALPSLGRTEDFATLTAQAEGNFASSSLISLTSPTPGQQVAAHSVDVTGTLSGSLNSTATVFAYVKGIQQNLLTSNGSFSGTLPVANGDNTIILLAAAMLDQQSNWYPNAATLIFDVTGGLPPTTLFTTLAWNQSDTDVDLYVTEPSPSNQTSWFASKQTTNLLTLDFDNTTGFGPEHTTLTTSGPNPGTVLPGDYAINVHYFSDHGTNQSVNGTVSIVLNEGMPNQVLITKPFTIGPSNPGNAAPGSTGLDWISIGTVDLVNGSITLAPQNARPVAFPTINQPQPAEYMLKKPPSNGAHD